MFKIFQGVWPALVTPTHADNSVNIPALHVLIDFLIAKGVHGFYIGGSTGDGIFISLPQRLLLTEAVIDYVAGRIPVIVHVGSICSDDAVVLARHACEQGAAAVSSIIPPLYDSIGSVYRYYQAIAECVPGMPVLAYLLNPAIDPTVLMRDLRDIPNIAGAKYTGANMYEFRQIVELGEGRWSMFSGMDEQAIYGCMMGATGLIGSTLNFMPGVYLAIHRHVQEGKYKEAQGLHEQANPVTAVLISMGFKGALRAVLTDLLHTDVGKPPLPGLPLTEEYHQMLKQKLDKTAFHALVAM